MHTINPLNLTNLSDLDTAFRSRRRLLQEQVRAASLVGRILHMARVGTTTVRHMLGSQAQFVDACSGPLSFDLAQPSMSWVDGPRTQPRSPTGRFLSKAWLADAELFLPADRAWFRSPVSTEGK